jgi:hypothetical protein
MNTYMIAQRSGGKGAHPVTTEFRPEFGTFQTVKEATDYIKYERLDFNMEIFFITLVSEMERIAGLKAGA